MCAKLHRALRKWMMTPSALGRWGLSMGVMSGWADMECRVLRPLIALAHRVAIDAQVKSCFFADRIVEPLNLHQPCGLKLAHRGQEFAFLVVDDDAIVAFGALLPMPREHPRNARHFLAPVAHVAPNGHHGIRLT